MQLDLQLHTREKLPDIETDSLIRPNPSDENGGDEKGEKPEDWGGGFTDPDGFATPHTEELPDIEIDSVMSGSSR